MHNQARAPPPKKSEQKIETVEPVQQPVSVPVTRIDKTKLSLEQVDIQPKPKPKREFRLIKHIKTKRQSDKALAFEQAVKLKLVKNTKANYSKYTAEELKAKVPGYVKKTTSPFGPSLDIDDSKSKAERTTLYEVNIFYALSRDGEWGDYYDELRSSLGYHRQWTPTDDINKIPNPRPGRDYVRTDMIVNNMEVGGADFDPVRYPQVMISSFFLLSSSLLSSFFLSFLPFSLLFGCCLAAFLVVPWVICWLG
eukprot:Lithocolla_globosa_v1_NODE_877_length_3148_cov_26.827675.p2 type:complete len:252 gc:universal NODE_877_length_3148_cov_26.827675:3146-2391(-)